jgi:hypothetical protein
VNRLIILFALGCAVGGVCAWWIQNQRLTAVQYKFDSFYKTVKATGEAAQKVADAKADEDQRTKEKADHEYKVSLASLFADNKRLRLARASSDIVPSTPAGSSRPDLACFDRTELEQTLQRFDNGVTQLVDEGDKNTLALNVAVDWAANSYSAPKVKLLAYPVQP